jgi:hypothetical protein
VRVPVDGDARRTFCGIFSFICMFSNNYGPSLPAWDDQITLK